jgi:hypothetical protein
MLDILVAFVIQTCLPSVGGTFFADAWFVTIGHARTATCLENFVFDNVDIIERTIHVGLAIQFDEVIAGVLDGAVGAIVGRREDFRFGIFDGR